MSAFIWFSSWSCSQAVSKPVWRIPLLFVQWKTSDDGQRNCLKHVEVYSKNKFDKLVHLVGFRPDPARKFSTNLWQIPLLFLQWKPPDDGQRNCPKHVEFYSKNKFEKLMHLVSFCPDPSRKLSANLYDIYHCCLYSENLLMMDRGTVRNM